MMIMNMILSQEAITEENEDNTAGTGRNPVEWKLKNEAESNSAGSHPLTMRKCSVPNNANDMMQMHK